MGNLTINTTNVQVSDGIWTLILPVSSLRYINDISDVVDFYIMGKRQALFSLDMRTDTINGQPITDISTQLSGIYGE